MGKIMDWAGILILVGMMVLLLYGLWISMKDSFPSNNKVEEEKKYKEAKDNIRYSYNNNKTVKEME